MLLSWPHSWEPAALAAGRREEHEVPRVEIRNGARLAAALGLGLTLSLGAAPVVALAEPADATSNVDSVVPRDGSVVTMKQGDGGATEYESISAALQDVEPYDYKTNKDVYTISLVQDTAEDVIIPSGVNVTIDLAGHKLTNVSGHTITNNATKSKIVDSSNGGGVVDNVTHGRGALYNSINAVVTLDGGTFMRSAEASSNANSSGSNSWYVLKNYGTMTINDGVTVKFSDANAGYYSSLIGNGWQNSSAAESGSNGEPKPSQGKSKATLNIKGGSFIGGKITIKNDDYGVLTVSGGTIAQKTDSYYAIYNANKATVSDGNISAKSDAIGSQHYDGGANEGSLTVTGGTISSELGAAVTLLTGAEGTIKGGTFDPGDGQHAIEVDGSSQTTITSGTFVGVSAEKVVNKEGSFADRYGVASDGNGNLVAGVTDAVAVVTSQDGSMTNYESLSKALSNAPAGSTVKLQENVSLTSKAATKNYGVTLDLNGFSISSSVTSDAAIRLDTTYGARPVEGVNNTMRLINSVPEEGGVVSGALPLGAKAGNSMIALPIEIGEGVTLNPTDSSSDSVKLESSAYLKFSERTVNLIKNGGFKVTAEDEDRIYGSYANAAGVSTGSAIVMLNDYFGAERINSGDHDATLDLGGHTYSYTGDECIVDVNYDDASLTIQNGSLKATDASSDGIRMLYSGSALILDRVNVEVVGGSYGIVTNGVETDNSVTLRESTLNVPEGSGIYFPSTGSVLIDNSSITAKNTGVQICAGSLRVQGDATSITVTGDPAHKEEGDGVITDGAAISIVEREGYQDLGTVSITGGMFTSKNGVGAIKAYAFSNSNKIEAEWIGAGDVVAVSGGLFSSAVPTAICADGLEPVTGGDGKFTVGVAESKLVTVSDADGNVLSAHDTLAEAIAAAGAGEVVTILDNLEVDSQVQIGTPDVTINGNGHTVTYTGAVTGGSFAFNGGLFDVTADGVQISDMVIDTKGNTKFGVQFYCAKGGKLTGVTIKGGAYACANVNGSEVSVSNSTLEPSDAAYAHIDFSMGSGVTEVPVLTIGDNVTFAGDQPRVRVDEDTMRSYATATGMDEDNLDKSAILDAFNKNLHGIQLEVNNQGDFVDETPSTPVSPPAQTGEEVKVEQPAGAEVSVSPSRADEGDVVTVTVTPEEGREVVSVTVTDADGNAVEVAPGEKDGEYAFEMPAGPVTVTAATRCDGGELCPSRGLADVVVGEWCHDAVDWAVETGLMTGYGHVAAFGVSDPLSRAQLAQVLWNRAGRPEADASAVAAFPDCSEGEFYAEAVAWCASEGIMTGYEDGTFGPADPVTREQLATVLWRAAGSPEADADLSAFPDAGSVSEFAEGAVAWAVGAGAISGQGSDGTLDPVGSLERAQCAMVFYRLDG